MIDIHSHILPAVDDGAQTLEEALQMLRIAVDNGVRTQVLTPHYQPGRYNNAKEALTARFAVFKRQVQDAGIDIRLHLAGEVRIGPEVMGLVAKNALPVLVEVKGKKAFLLEFPRQDIPFGSENLVRWVIDRGYLPIIAHPERNRTLMSHPERLSQLCELGCLLQVTASSLTGKFGREVQYFAQQLVDEQRVFAVASDCHNLTSRPPDLRPELYIKPVISAV